MIYINKNIVKGVSYEKNGSSSNNRAWLKLEKSFFGLQFDIFLCAVYIPPLNSTHYNNDYEILQSEISKFSNLGKIALIGYFNSRIAKLPDFIENDSLDLNDLNENNLLPDDYLVDQHIPRNNEDLVLNIQGKNLLDLCMSARLRILNGRFIGDSLGFYTCISPSGYSTVDYAVVSESLLPSVQYFKTGDFSYISDHVQVEFFLKCNKNKANCTDKPSEIFSEILSFKWNDNSLDLLLKSLDTDELKEDIINFELKSFSQSQTGIDEACFKLTAILSKISEKSCTIKKRIKNIKKKTYKKKQKWSDSSVKEFKNLINKVGKELRSQPFNLALKQKYFHLIKSFRKLTKQKKYEYNQKIYEKFSDICEKNPKELWKILNSYNPKKYKNDENEEEFPNYNDTMIHFQHQGTCPDTDMNFNNYVLDELKKIETNLSINLVTDKPITCHEIKEVLSKLKNGKASGPDKVLYEVIKYSSPITLNSFAKFFNLILELGFYPENWNKSFIILIHKSGDKCNPGNYRGISLINCLSKFFSSILNNRLINFMKNNFSNCQFGFRENHRTTDSLFILKSLINKYLHKNNEKIYACYVDLKGAFDSVWRDGLLFKLANLGIGKNIYTVIKKQLSNTESALKLNGARSPFYKIKRGVRQ